jgi:methylmalonyl-CoA mutase
MTNNENTLQPELTLRDDFPAVSYDDWRAIAEVDLKGASFERKLVSRTYEGIDVQPVYTRADGSSENDAAGFPGTPPFVRGSHALGAVQTGWDLRQEHAHPDLAITNRNVLDDLQGGVISILLRLDCAARNGCDPDDPAASELAGRDGVMVYHVDDLDSALKDVDLQSISVALEAGSAFVPAAAALAALWQRRGIAKDVARGAFNADPLAVLARDGQLPVLPSKALSMMADLASWTADHYPHVTAVRVGTAAYHQAGATAAQDLAFAVASGIEYLRAMTAAGLDISTAAQQIVFNISLGTHHFLAIAKLRAARRLWARAVAVCGGSPESAAMRIHAQASNRVMTQRDPYVNLLRNTVAVFAAGVGGAEIITSVPFDSASGLPDELSRRIARNTVLILQEEAHLNQVIDPPGGSWYLDCLTNQLAEKAWENFQEVERQGGMLEAIQSGWVVDQIDSAFAPRAKDIARRKEGITGISEFPDLGEERVNRPEPDRGDLRKKAADRISNARRDGETLNAVASADSKAAAALEAAVAGASFGQLAKSLGFHEETTNITPLAPHPFAEPFEELRDASDAWYADQGYRPRVFLANLGPLAHHTARAAYSKNFFEAGGLEVVSNNGFEDADSAAAALSESGARVAVICSSDKLYPDLVPEVVPKLKAAGARTVVLAGNPGGNEEAWREAGVDRFIFMKCDVLTTLRDILSEEGVLTS